ncbi:MAG: SH3 domain-containing protein [Anaerolineae bacterium]|nr:SH3 domain-containing protein [Anaerolineae bacterium]
MFTKFAFTGICLAALLLTACGGGSTPPSEVVQAVTVDVEASVTAAVMTALAETNAVADTPVPPSSTVAEEAAPDPTEASSEEASATAAPTAAVSAGDVVVVETAVIEPPLTCFTLQGVNIRYGPGVSYEPALRLLPATETLIPLAFSAVGYPSGQWVQVQVAVTGEVGWVSASPQFMTCNFVVNTLPPAASIPATPAPVSVPAAPPVVNNQGSGSVNRPMNVEEKVTGGEVDFDPLMDFNYQFNDGFLLRLDIKNNHDLADADVNGRGISKVSFEVFSDATGQSVYKHEEGTAGYCIFRGGEPDCRPWPQNANGRYTWGEGGPEVEPGTYSVNVFITPKNPEFEGQSWFWGSTFAVSP